jgi:arylsulfatase A-like enzyme
VNRILLLLASAATGVIAVRGAFAQCSTSEDLGRLQSSLRRELQCASAVLGTGAPLCATSAPPCAGDAIAAALEVALGGTPPAIVDPIAARPQLRCQRAILRAAANYLAARPTQLAQGRRRADANRVLPRVNGGCRGVTVRDVGGGAPLPRLGVPCANAIGGPGSAVDAEHAGRCLRATLEAIAHRIAPAPLPPNVIIVETDDQNVASLAQMPNVLRLVGERGVTFENAFVTTPVCSPSRASMLTGRYPRHHGITNNFNAAARFGSSDGIARWFADAGYHTGLIGKFMNMTRLLGTTVPPNWHEWIALLEEGLDGNGSGFYDYALNVNGTLVSRGSRPDDYSTDVLAARAVGFVRANARRPFLLVFTPFAPHIPSIPAPRHELHFLFLPAWRPPNWREADVSLKPTWVKFMKAHPAPVDSIDAHRADQLRTLQAVDEAVAAIDATLEDLGIADNTILLFTSDHGYHWGEHWWYAKFSAYEESLRVPLLVRYPRLWPERATRSELALNIDLAPTLAELAGVQAPPDIDGQSLVPLLAGVSGGRPDFLIESGASFIIPPWSGVRTERWKYVLLEASQGVTEELYDLEQDPYELQNLAFDSAHAGTLDALRVRLAELTAQ